MDFLPAAFAAMANYAQFIVYVCINRGDRLDKVPIDWQTGIKTDAHNSAVWTTAEHAIEVAKLFGRDYGVGFVLTKDDPFFFLDIDKCVNKDQWSDLAVSLLSTFNGCAVEISRSQCGLHIFGRGQPPAHRCKNALLGLELYTQGRFIALTGLNAIGNADYDASQLLPWLVDNYFKIDSDSSPVDWTNVPHAEWSGPSDDAVLLERMLKSQSNASIFGGKARFKDIWENNTNVLSLNYPNSDGTINYSDVDAALASHLAFWTGSNCERMHLLMRSCTALCRAKWDREDYLRRTILYACSVQKKWAKEITSTPNSETIRINHTSAFLPVDQQVELFKDCYYLQEENLILVSSGHKLNAQQFENTYGGYCFPLDLLNTKTTPNAWKAFTQSQALREHREKQKVRGIRFDPRHEPGSVITVQGDKYVNSYRKIDTPRKKGDPHLFLDHLKLMIGNDRDIQILLSYMAAVLRYPGHKFNWCPIIQGMPGNGKSLTVEILCSGVGERYIHVPKLEHIHKFNNWLEGKILIEIREVYHGSRDLLEILKDMVTGKTQTVEPKGKDQLTKHICCNFIMTTNHKDGLPKHCADRRIAPFYTLQQYPGDLERSGMTEEYFVRLNYWLRKEDGFAICCDYLDTYAIPDEFNPMVYGTNAPRTSSTIEAVEQGRGVIEQEILEAISREDQGFRKGWVSSIMLDRLLTQLRLNIKISPTQRQEMLRNFGYIRHPNLHDGRVNNITLPDNAKPRLFIKHDHYAATIVSPAEIAAAYKRDQT